MVGCLYMIDIDQYDNHCIYIYIFIYIYIYTNVVYLEDSAEKQLTLRLGNMVVQITKIDCNSLCNVQYMAYVVVCP